MKSRKKAVRSRFRLRHVKGALKAGGAKIGIIVADFNEHFTSKLLEGAVDTLSRHGVKTKNICVFHTPGSLEIPLVVKRLVKKQKFDALITLGMVIKGNTRHFRHVVDGAARGTLEASLKSNIPVIHGVVAAENVKQAMDRTGGKLGNKGRDFAKAALQMASLMKKV